MNNSLLVIGLISLPLVASPLVYLFGRASVRKGNIWGLSLAKLLTLLVLVADGVLLFFTTQKAVTVSGVYTYIGSTLLYFDGIALLLSAVVLVLGFCVTIFSFSYMENEDGEEKFYALLLILIGSIIGLGFAQDIFNLWVWFEVMALSSYFLVAFYHEQPASLEAGIKYLTQSALGSTLALFGIAILFGMSGSVSMDQILTAVSGKSPLGLIAGAMVIIGFGVKAALVPLHTWLPDAHSQAPSGISAMLSGIVIEAGLVAMLRVVGALAYVDAPWGIILLVFGCLNVLIGNLMALRQTEVKRLLAYSSIAKVGYMVVGLGVSVTFLKQAYDITAASGSFFHLMTHAMMKGLAFLAAGALLYSLHISKGDHSPLVLSDLNGASKKYPMTAFMFSLALLGLGGIPPMAGFMSKWQILLGTINTQNAWLIGVAIFVALNSILSLGYYAPMVNRIYRLEASETVAAGKPISWSMTVPMVILTVIVVVLGVWPSLASIFTSTAAVSFLTPFGG